MGQNARYPLINAPFLREVKEYNTELWDNLARLRVIAAMQDEADAYQVELCHRLQKLRDQLETQFELEETYGYIGQAALIDLVLHQRVEKARSGHRWLILALMELCEMVGDLEYRGTLRCSLESVLKELRCFLSNLEAHEKLEDELMGSKSLQPVR